MTPPHHLRAGNHMTALVVPRDCIASPSATETRHALFVLKRALRARTPLASSLRFGGAKRGDAK